MSEDKTGGVNDGVVGRETGEVEMGVAKALEALDSLQSELDKVNDEASEKVLQVEQKYNKVRKPIYVKRNDVIAKVADFWKTAFLHHPVLADLITEDDEEALHYLREVMVDDSEDIESGFKITFNFRTNPFFEDTELEKSVSFAEDGTLQVDGTPPNWKEGMGPTEEVGAVGAKRSRAHVFSFFQWFVESGTLDTGQQDEIAAIIKDDIWPNPLKYYQEEVEELEAYTDQPPLEEDDEDDEGDEDDFGEEGFDEGYMEGGDQAAQAPANGEVQGEYEEDEDEDDEDQD